MINGCQKFDVWFYLLLLDLHTDFSGGMSGSLVFPSLEEFSTVCGDLVKVMVFPVVMYGCESWTVKKAEC